MTVHVGAEVLDPILDRQVDLDQAHRHGSLGRTLRNVGGRVVGRHQQVVLLFVMGLAPQEPRLRDRDAVRIDLRHVPDVQLHDLAGGVQVSDVHRPGQLEVQPRADVADLAVGCGRPAEPLDDPFLVRADDHEATGQIQRRGRKQDQRDDRLFEKLVEPGLRHLESELVIHRGGHAAEDTAGLVDDAQEPAVERSTAVLVLEPRPVDVEDEVQDRLGAQDQQQIGAT